jgi:hypothetical protein
VTNCTTKTIEFSPIKSKKVTADFAGGDITSDAGVLLLREIDKKLGFTESLSGVIPDLRDASYCDHSILTMLRQRIYGLALGYEDLNDHDYLRKDIAFQTAVGKEEALASKPTLSRFENSVDRSVIVAMNKLLLETFIKTHQSPPKELILDFDATDDLIHGHQEFRHYHGYYREYCYMPLYIFCGEHLITSFLRPSNIDGAKHSWAVLALLVKRLRKEWPEVKIIFRGDCGFNRHQIFDWSEKHNVYYVVGQPSNNILQNRVTDLKIAVAEDYNISNEKQRTFAEFNYAAKTWKKERRIIVKAEHNYLGDNTRFIVTNLSEEAQVLYDDIYCARGNMENMIKQQQLDLFADRTSCHKWFANQFRLLLSGCAYTLILALKNAALRATDLANAYCGNIRLKLFKIGAVIISNTRRIKFMLASHFPYQDLFRQISAKLCSG